MNALLTGDGSGDAIDKHPVITPNYYAVTGKTAHLRTVPIAPPTARTGR